MKLRCKYFSILTAAICIMLIVGCGGERMRSDARNDGRKKDHAGFAGSIKIPGVALAEIGHGAGAAQILSGTEPAGRQVVIFLHGFGPTTPLLYRAWMSHLVRGGATVIFPVYQGTALAKLPQNVQTSVRAALKRLPVVPSSVVVAGQTSGAALAIDYAVTAAAAGLPRACGVYGVFPGVKLDANANIPLSNPAKIPAASTLVLVAGPSDPVPGGTGLAKAIIAGARQVPRSRRSLLDAPGDNPDGPVEQTAASRRAYWKPLDRLIADCAKRE